MQNIFRTEGMNCEDNRLVCNQIKCWHYILDFSYIVNVNSFTWKFSLMMNRYNNMHNIYNIHVNWTRLERMHLLIGEDRFPTAFWSKLSETSIEVPLTNEQKTMMIIILMKHNILAETSRFVCVTCSIR